ncbi:MAG: SRPBCC family protein [Prevotellaceae bacterium]|jgi:carbon monoxide dehydrogenase subunit G|nr:SRPBCC family protein [Prevotellaceae bacterium]
MTTYESKIKTIAANNNAVFSKLADLRNLESLTKKIPSSSGVSDMECDKDSVSFQVNPVGKIILRIVEREEPKTIKFGAENSPIPFNLWIQLVGKTDSETQLKVSLKTDLPMMVKMMVGNKLGGFVDQFADMLAGIEY